MAVRFREAVVLRLPPGSKGSLRNPGAVIHLAHDRQLHGPGIVTGNQGHRNTKPGICLAVIGKALFPVPSRWGLVGEHFINGPIALSGQKKGLGRVQALTEHACQVIEMGQLIVHKKAGILPADILEEISVVSPVAEADTAGGVHQIAVPAAQGESGEKNRLAF